MALSKTLLCCLVLIAVVVQIESRVCLQDHWPFNTCTKHCCGVDHPYTCADDCSGTICNEDSDCGDQCCRDNVCDDCPFSVAVIAGISAGGVVFLIIIIAICVCCCGCCGCCRSEPRPVVVGQWAHLPNPVASPSVNVVNTSSHTYMQHWAFEEDLALSNIHFYIWSFFFCSSINILRTIYCVNWLL